MKVWWCSDSFVFFTLATSRVFRNASDPKKVSIGEGIKHSTSLFSIVSFFYLFKPSLYVINLRYVT